MIDYEKLKIAHELACNLKEKFRDVRIDCHLRVGCDGTNYVFYSMNNDDFQGMSWESEHDDIDGLIAHLKELTQPEKPKPKYEAGQEVWVLRNTEIYSFKIDEIIKDECYWYLNYLKDGSYSDWKNEFDQYREDSVYPTREYLIDAQIDYLLRHRGFNPDVELANDILEKAVRRYKETISKEYHSEDEKVECQHESDCRVYLRKEGAFEKPYEVKRCKKCGEIYR